MSAAKYILSKEGELSIAPPNTGGNLYECWFDEIAVNPAPKLVSGRIVGGSKKRGGEVIHVYFWGAKEEDVFVGKPNELDGTAIVPAGFSVKTEF